MKSAFKHTLFTYCVLGLLSLLFFNLAIFDFIEDAFDDFNYLDLVQSKNIFKYDKVNSDIILVNVENRDREELALLIEHLANQSPKVIGVDVLFKENRNPIKDSILSSVLKQHKNLLVGSFINPDISNHKNFKFSKEGFINFNTDEKDKNVIRDYITKLKDSTSFAYKVAKKANDNIIDPFSNAKPIKYYGNYNQFLHMSFDDVLLQEKIPSIKNKIVLLGYLGVPLGNVNDILDKKFTPINSDFTGKTIPDMYGVTVHANIINSLIKKDFIKQIPTAIIFILSFIITFFVSKIFLNLYQKNYAFDGLITKLFQFVYTFLILWISILFFTKSIKLPVALIIACPLLAIELIPYAKSLNKYFQKRWGF